MIDDDFHKETTLPPPSTNREVSDTNEIPKKIGSYIIESLFEKGGMSVLYLGIHEETKEPAIIKVLSKKYLLNTEVVKRFLKEADIIAMTNHPNIVKLFGHGDWEGGLYMAIEFVPGISLRQYILQKHISLKRSLEMIIEIAYALCHLHMHGVIHRDLKPDNILISDSGIIKVIDFGIAQLLTEESEKTAGKPHFIGTPVYMSPEQKDNPELVSYPSDIYSLAIICYELVLGKLSHGQLHLGLMPKGLRKILTKALQPDPKLRYQDVVDFISDTSAYLNSDSIKEDLNIRDHLSELSENLKSTQLILVPEKAPAWELLDVGIATNKDVSLYGFQQGLYQDFFEIPNGIYGIIMTESSLKNKETLVYTAATRGMIRALCKLTNNPQDLVTILNDLIINDPLRHNLSLSYVIIEPKEKNLQYIACGQGQRCYYFNNQIKQFETIINLNPFLGMDLVSEFTALSHTFNSGDMLFLISFSGQLLETPGVEEFLEKELTKNLIENPLNSPKQRLQDILKRLNIIYSKSFYDSIICLIAIKHK
jgi:serine/threonine protein kinase